MAGDGEPAQPTSDSGPGKLAQRLDWLFLTVHPSSGPYSYDQVSKAVAEHSGETMSPNYIWRLRTGARKNPHPDKVAALAAFFSVPVAYFYDDRLAAQINEQIELLSAARDAGVHHIASRASSMSAEEARQALLSVAAIMAGEDPNEPTDS